MNSSRATATHTATKVTISLVVAAALGACGKSTKDQRPTTAETKVQASGNATVPAGGGSAVTTKAVAQAPSRGPERAVYSLVDNRLSAHLTRGGGLLIPGGSAGFAKYIRFGNQMGGTKKAWELRQSSGDLKVARLSGKNGSLFVPLTAAQASQPVIRFRIRSKGEGVISVRVNDQKDLNQPLVEGWSTVELTVPAGQLREGENQLALFTKPGELEVAWVQIGGEAPGDDGATQFYDPAAKALVLPKGGALSWYVSVPERALVTGDLADGSCQINVLATGEDGTTVDGRLTGKGSAVDLASLAGKAVRLDLEATGCDKASLASAALVVPGAVQAVKRGDPPKYVVFVIMDSLRADHVRGFAPKVRAEAPTFEKLAATSALFQQNYVQGNESQVSHSAMWTSMYLAKHKASQMKDILPARFVTIDEVAKKAGQYVAGVSANGYIRPKRGFGSGWDKFVNHIESSMGLRGSDVLDKGLSFVTPKKDQPFFLYLGLIDTHVTLRAKAPWLDRYSPDYKGRFATSFGDDGPGGIAKDLTDKEKAHVRALYDANVSYQDDVLGQLITKLEGWGIWDQTMLVVTADHGDELWEDGRFGHGGSVRETLVRVPLLIHYPPMIAAGPVTEATEGIDIVPTIADALGVAHDPEWQGASLIPLSHGQEGYPMMSFASRYEIGHAGRIGHWKAVLKSAGTPSVYDLAKDPDELNDVFEKAHIGTRLLLDPMWMLRSWNEEWKKAQWGNAADVSSRFAADLGE